VHRTKGLQTESQTSSGGNRLSDFPPDEFTIVVFCDSCDHSSDLNREKVPESMTTPEIRQHLRCSECGSRECSLRMIYSGVGGFRHC